MHRRCPHGAGDQGQVFQAWPPLLQRPKYKFMPIFASFCFDQPAFVVFFNQAPALALDLEDQRSHIARQHDVAAAPQHELGPLPERVGQRPAHVIDPAHPNQLVRPGRDAKAVVGLQGYLPLNEHGRIVALCDSGWT